jgi:SAM-dependent methyltransferase
MTAVNHHADHPGFAGVTGLLAGLTMIPGRGVIARLAADLTSVSANDYVLDVGCGPGTAVREATRRGARATGIDPAPVMLWLAEALTRKHAGITWAEGTAEDLRQPDASATVLWCVATVHHWKDVGAGLAEARRVLAPGGRLLAIERRVRPGATGLASHGWTGPQAEAFAAQCRVTGFDDVRVEQHVPGRRALWAVRAIRRPG